MIFLILSINYLLYYFIISPFGFIYRITKGVQYVITFIVTTVSFLIFWVLHKGDVAGITSLDEIGMDRKVTPPTTMQIERDVGILFDDLRMQLNSENLGTFDNIYNQIIDKAQLLSPNKKKMIYIKCEAYKIEIDEIKEKFHLPLVWIQNT